MLANLMKSFVNELFGAPMSKTSRVVLPSAPGRPPQRARVNSNGQLATVHNLMQSSDIVTVIGLAKTAGYIAAPSPLGSPQIDSRVREIPSRMSRLGSKGQLGATNFAAALQEARDVMRKQSGRRLKRIVLVSDGDDNVDTTKVMPLVRELAGMRVRIDAVAFGPWSSTRRLDEIAGGTGGRVLRAQNLRDLKAALKTSSDRIPPRQAGGRLAAIAVLVDISGSMYTEMAEEGGRKRIDVAVEAILDWLNYQRAAYA